MPRNLMSVVKNFYQNKFSQSFPGRALDNKDYNRGGLRINPRYRVQLELSDGSLFVDVFTAKNGHPDELGITVMDHNINFYYESTYKNISLQEAQAVLETIYDILCDLAYTGCEPKEVAKALTIKLPPQA